LAIGKVNVFLTDWWGRNVSGDDPVMFVHGGGSVIVSTSVKLRVRSVQLSPLAMNDSDCPATTLGGVAVIRIDMIW
jgi:hypothetical protein